MDLGLFWLWAYCIPTTPNQYVGTEPYVITWLTSHPLVQMETLRKMYLYAFMISALPVKSFNCNATTVKNNWKCDQVTAHIYKLNSIHRQLTSLDLLAILQYDASYVPQYHPSSPACTTPTYPNWCPNWLLGWHMNGHQTWCQHQLLHWHPSCIPTPAPAPMPDPTRKLMHVPTPDLTPTPTPEPTPKLTPAKPLNQSWNKPWNWPHNQLLNGSLTWLLKWFSNQPN